jgi:hypothetical protein
VILIQHLFGEDQVTLDLALLAPGQPEQRIEIVAHDGRLGRHRAHGLELLELGLCLQLGFLAELGLGDALLDLGNLVRALFAVTQFLLDRLHLLVEVVFALRLLHLPLDAAADALFHLQDADFAFHQAKNFLEALGDRNGRKQVFFLVDLDDQVAGNGVSKLAVVFDLADGRDDLGRNLLVELHIAFELGSGRARQGLDLGGVFPRALATRMPRPRNSRRFGGSDRWWRG